MKRIEFGIPLLDAGLTGAPVLLRALPGVDPRPFVAQAVARFDGPIVYLAVDRTAKSIRRQLSEKLPNLEVSFLDAHAPLIGQPADGLAVSIENPASLVSAIQKAAKLNPNSMLVLDGLANIALYLGPNKFAGAWPSIVEAAHKFRVSMAVFTDWDASPPDLHTFGDEVRLHGILERIITHEFFRVQPTGQAPMKPVMYRADGAGVRVYIPKIVVTGPADSGKTTFIAELCDKMATTERSGTTVAGERGTAHLDGLVVELFGTPGQDRFDPLLPALLNQAVAVVLMVDASNRDHFQRARDMLKLVRAAGHHVLVVANKQDLPQADGPEQIATALGLTDDTPVVGCNALHPQEARDALSALVNSIIYEEPVVA